MTIIDGLTLGLIQGLTEFIPISSSGHLVLAQAFLSGASDHLFLEWINIGTVLALILFFRKRIFEIAHQIFIDRDLRMARNVLIAALPAGIVGFVLASVIEETPFFSSPWTVVTTLAIVGILLVVLERLPRFSQVDDGKKLPWQRALAIGTVQTLALIPGTSRSGSTIIAGRLAGLSRKDAAEFSFLVSIPIMLGVLLKLCLKSADRAYFLDHIEVLVLGNIAAFVAGMIAVGFLMRFLEKRSLAVFGWYRICLALVVTVFLLVK